MKTLLITAALAAFAASVAPMAAAADFGAHNVSMMHITAHDLDLSRAGDADVMAVRISQAASKVCGATAPVSDLRERAHYQACVADAVRATLKQIDAPLVSARFATPATRAQLAVR